MDGPRQIAARGPDPIGMRCECECEQPDFRATIRRDGTIRLVDWRPRLATGGPLYLLLEARGAHRQALCEWAARVGYRRVWFDGEVVELDPAPGGLVQTRCTGCMTRLADAEAHFWERVRRRGAFPTACVLCGCDLPQWTPGRQTGAGARDSTATQTSRRTTCK